MKIISEIVKIFDIEPFESGEGNIFRFRLEVAREIDTNIFYGIIYRLETYRLQPTFPQQQGRVPNWQHDGLIYVIDDNYTPEMLKGNSIEDVLTKFHCILTERFTAS